MDYEPLAAVLVTYAIVGCLLLLTIGAILCFPGPPRHPPALRRTEPHA
ncbi:MAG: hypothetical protein H6Q77_399 [Gemmatimonadetes bacterium]|jgi:hypothetical protein|nr:hypothetical protein [Gemmatimonadota bacterium]